MDEEFLTFFEELASVYSEEAAEAATETSAERIEASLQGFNDVVSLEPQGASISAVQESVAEIEEALDASGTDTVTDQIEVTSETIERQPLETVTENLQTLTQNFQQSVVEAEGEGVQQGAAGNLAAFVEPLTVAIESIEDQDADEALEGVVGSLNQFTEGLIQTQSELIEGSIEVEEAQARTDALLAQTTDQLSDLASNDVPGLAQAISAIEETTGTIGSTFNETSENVEDLEQIATADLIGLAGALGEAGAGVVEFERIVTGLQDRISALTAGFRGLSLTQGFLFFTGALGLTALFNLIDAFGEVEDTVRSVRDETGLLVSQIRPIEDAVISSRQELEIFDVTTEQAASAATTLLDRFGSLDSAAAALGQGLEQTVTRSARLSSALGISVEEATTLQASFEQLSRLSGGSAENALIVTRQLSEQAGVAPQAVFQDIASSSEQLAKFSSQSVESIAAAAVEARQLGLSLGDIAGLQEQFLSDITGTVTGIQQAAVATGQQLDAQRLIAASYEGTGALVDELRNQLEGIDVENLDFFQRQQLSDALNISPAQLERVARLSEITDDIGQQELISRVQSGDLSFQEAFSVGDSQTQLEQVQNQLNALGATIVKELLPPLRDLAVAVIPVVIDAFEFFAPVVGAIVEPLSDFADLVSGTAEGFDVLTGVVGGFMALGLLTYMGKLVASFAGGVRNMFSFASAAEDAADAASTAAQTARGAAGAADDLAAGAARGAGGVSKLGGAMSNFVGSFSASAGVGIAASLIGLAGAVFILSEAAQNFEQVGAGAILATLGTTLVTAAVAFPIFSAALSAASGTISAAAPVIGVALVVFGGLAGVIFTLSEAATSFAEAANEMIPFFTALGDQILQLAEAAPALPLVALGLQGISAALASFAVSGILGGIGSLFTGGFIEDLERLAELANPLNEAADAVRVLASSMSSLNNVSIEGVPEQLEQTIEATGGMTVAEPSPQQGFTQSPEQVDSPQPVQAQAVQSPREMQVERTVNLQGETTVEALLGEFSPEEIVSLLQQMVENQKVLNELFKNGAVKAIIGKDQASRTLTQTVKNLVE